MTRQINLRLTLGILLAAVATSVFAADTTPPSMPTNVTPLEISSTAATVNWTASTDNVGVTGYRIYRDGTQIGTASGTSFTDNGPLNKYISYEYSVAAYDAAGNVSGTSTPPAVFAYRRFPFVIPWNDATSNVTDMSGLNVGAANIQITSSNGHLYSGSNRVRLLGVNLVFGACCPPHNVATTLAARLAKLGINCVRLHGTDKAIPNGLLKADLVTLDPTQMDNLDYLVSQLKSQGIYIDVNLHTHRAYPGFPTACASDVFKGVDIYYPGMVTIQKNYAHDLLTHTNPYTGYNYASDPAVAFVEINNEDGLIAQWAYGRIFDSDVVPVLDPSYSTELKTQWNNWLATRYGNITAVTQAWAPSAGSSYGVEKVTNGNLSGGFVSPWRLQVTSPAVATQQLLTGGSPNSTNALQVDITTSGTSAYQVQFFQNGIGVTNGQPYTFSFWAKANAARTMTVAFQQDISPYSTLAGADVSLTSNWQQYVLVLTPNTDCSATRILFTNLGPATGTVWASDFSVKTGNTILGVQSSTSEALVGTEMLTNGDFHSAFALPWRLQVTSPAVSTQTEIVGGNHDGTSNALQIATTTAGSAAWHVQLYQNLLNVTANQPYTVSFWAKSDQTRTALIQIGQDTTPYSILASQSLPMTSAWQQYTCVLYPTASCTNARFNLTNLGIPAGNIWVSNFSFQSGKNAIAVLPGETIGTMSIVQNKDFATRSRGVQHDWIQFLWDTESSFWTAMSSYLKTTLGAKGLIIGTQARHSPFGIQANMDVVDIHSYWGHPQFPGVLWDPVNWNIQNIPMSASKTGSIISTTAESRVMNKPYVCTEFNQPAPSTYTGESPLLFAAYGALQDWDAIFFYSYLYTTGWSRGYFNNWFEIGLEPNKLVSMAATAAIFRSGDIASGSSSIGTSVATVDSSTQIAMITAIGVPLLGATDFGIDPMNAARHLIGVQTGSTTIITAPWAGATPNPALSMTGQLSWDTTQGLVKITGTMAKAFIGTSNQATVDLGDGVTITPNSSVQGNGWATVSLIVKSGAGFATTSGSNDILLTATGYTDNHRMLWQAGMGPADATSSVNANWGQTPTLMEGVWAAVTLPFDASKVTVWALDVYGNRTTTVPVSSAGSGSTFTIIRNYNTPWYEIVTVPNTPLEIWRQQYFGSIANSGAGADRADANNDGVPNLLEYALNANPTMQDFRKLPVVGSANSYLTLKFRSPSTATDVTYHVEASSDLKNWDDVDINSHTVATGFDIDGTAEITVCDNVPMTGNARRFIRLRITNP